MMDIVEEFLQDGLPDKPESRATKADLERHIEKRDILLESLRKTLLSVVSKSVEVIENNPPVNQLTDHQLNTMVGPVDHTVKFDAFDTGEEVCGFINKIGSHNIVSVSSCSNKYIKAGQETNSGVLYIVFYRHY